MFNEFEHDYTKMLNFMRKSLNFFKLSNPHITKPFIDSIDFIIINFPYFLDINMVADYLLTDNQEFNYVFYSKIRIFLNIINYNDMDISTTNDNNKIISSLSSKKTFTNSFTLDSKKVSNVNNNIINNQFTSKSIDSNYLNVKCINNKLNLWNNILGRSTKEKLYKWLNNDLNICTINNKDIVLKLFFKILVYHFDEIKINFKNNTIIEKLLNKLHIDDILVKKIFDYDKSIFNNVKNIVYMLLENNKFDILEDIIKFNIYNIKIEDIKNLVYRFLASTNYLDYKILYNIIYKILKCLKIKIPIFKNLLIENGKFLICYNNDLNLEEIWEPPLHSFLVDLFFNDIQFFHLCAFNFIRTCILKRKLNIIKILDKKYKEGLSQYYSKKPNIENIFSYVLLFYKCRLRRLEQLCYKDIVMINKFLDEYYDESLVRYICKLVIDEIPVLNILEE
ncbi:hypothetical protein NAPIS_ORF01363 [Vairimorpha apis BRL 01]|uniref:Uncharacterized protein n=1 Tax=Vairimorpha apis BRL 01 TaxID=1037528 RepID=T0L9A1_9MICR|nr:hypothetical protein NAPIS_ORF01363 [Vairimorpha apis BRL 01]